MYRALLLLLAAACLTVPAYSQCNHMVMNPVTHKQDCNDGFFVAANASASSVPAVTSLTVTHNLNTFNIIPFCFVTTTGVPVTITSMSGQTLNAVTLNFASTANVQCNVNGTGGTGPAGSNGAASTIPGPAGPPGSMAIPYTQAVVAQTSVAVTQATHAQGTLALAICFDNAGTPVAVNCNYARDGSGNITFTFSPAFTGTIEIFGGSSTNSVALRVRSFAASFDGAGGALLVNAVSVPKTIKAGPGTITDWSLCVDQGTATVKIWKIASGTAIPTVANVINTSGLSIASGTCVDSSNVSDFTGLTVTVNDKFIVTITAVAGGATKLDLTVGYAL